MPWNSRAVVRATKCGGSAMAGLSVVGEVIGDSAALSARPAQIGTICVLPVKSRIVNHHTTERSDV
jgi:hypothetical protein